MKEAEGVSSILIGAKLQTSHSMNSWIFPHFSLIGLRSCKLRTVLKAKSSRLIAQGSKLTMLKTPKSITEFN
jgi:hypothetical protein